MINRRRAREPRTGAIVLLCTLVLCVPVTCLPWECCGETHPPAPNDLLNTAIGGMSLGEMLYRTSARILDNNATGTERVFREIGGALANPQRGVSRLAHGYTDDVAPNGPGRSPSWIGAALDVGYRLRCRAGASEPGTAD